MVATKPPGPLCGPLTATLCKRPTSDAARAFLTANSQFLSSSPQSRQTYHRVQRQWSRPLEGANWVTTTTYGHPFNADRAQQQRRCHRQFSTLGNNTRQTKNTKDLNEKWKSKTKSILEDIPIGGFQPSTWTEAKETIRYWMVHREDVEICWRILYRLYSEATTITDASNSPQTTTTEVAKSLPIQLPIDLSNPLINLWRNQLKENIQKRKKRSASNPDKLLLPSQLSQDLIKYEKANLLRRDEYTHSLILDAAAALAGHARDFPRDGVYFAEDYICKWLEDYLEQQDNTTKTTTVVPVLDAVAFGSIIHAWVSSRLPQAPQKAEEWLDIASKAPFHIQPNQQLYTSVISAHANQGNPMEAQKWLKRMHTSNIVPDISAWNTLLLAWVKHQPSTSPPRQQPQKNHATIAQRVDSMLHQMWKFYEAGKISEPPDVVSYSIAIDAWAKQAHPRNKEAARRAQTLLNQMKELSSQQEKYKSLQPNTVTYNSVITALARAGCHLEAEALLKEMIMMDEANVNSNYNPSDTAARPDVQSFSVVIWGWSKVGTIAAAERAESWLKEGMKSCGVQPNVQAYSNCINCWAKASASSRTGGDASNGPAQRAQALFDEMKQPPLSLSPDVVAYTALMNAWGRQGNPWKVEQLMEELLLEYRQARQIDGAAVNLKPSAHTFSAILSAWSHSQHPEAAERAEEWMKRMSLDEYGGSISPNIVSYSILLDAWAKSHHPQAPDRAKDILDHLESLPDLQPNYVSYTTVVKAYANHGRAEEAEAMTLGMLENPKLPNPDVYTFSSALSAWSKAIQALSESSPNSSEQQEAIAQAAGRAERLLVKMHQLHNDGILDRPPNVVCYGGVLACLARSSSVDPSAAERAEGILRMMQKHDDSNTNKNKKNRNRNKESLAVEPNLICYNTVMNAWAQQASRDDAAVARVEALLDELEKRSAKKSSLLPDAWSYGALMKAISRSKIPNKLERSRDVLRQMEEMRVKPTSGILHQIKVFETEDHRP